MATPTDGTGGTLSVTSDSADNVTVNGTSGPVEQGSGVSKKDARSVGIYSRIAFSGTIRGEVTIEAGHSVEISGDDNIVPLIETVVEDGVLWIRPTKSMAPKTPLVATIKTTSLAGIVVDGANTVSVRGISGDLFAIDAHGAATVTAVGAAKRAEIELDGAGTIDASELKAGDVTVTAAGTGDIDVSATGVLDVTITGTAKVRYRGKPRDIRQQITGVGSLEAK